MFKKAKEVIEENINCNGVCAFEAAFGIEVAEKDIRKFAGIKDIIDYPESNV